MNPTRQNPALVIVILWGIAIFTTTFLFMAVRTLLQESSSRAFV